MGVKLSTGDVSWADSIDPRNVERGDKGVGTRLVVRGRNNKLRSWIEGCDNETEGKTPNEERGVNLVREIRQSRKV